MSRQAKIIIFGIILAYSIYSYKTDTSIFDNESSNSEIKNDAPKKNIQNDLIINSESTFRYEGKTFSYNTVKSWADDANMTIIDYVNEYDIEVNNEILENENLKNTKPLIVRFPQPENGFSPYDNYFGRGIYDNDSGNEFIIKNSNSTDAVVLLVNAYSGKKVRNEYIRKGSTFSMTGVPNGTYYLQWSSGNSWSPKKIVGRLVGGFQEDISFAKTENSNDWMTVDGYKQWTVTLYSVTGGDVETDNISASEFAN